MGIWEEPRVQKHEHAKLLRYTCIADIFVTTTILLLLVSRCVNYYYYYYYYLFMFCKLYVYKYFNVHGSYNL
jgi:hypothetical protein